MIFSKLVIDNKNVADYSVFYLDNTGIWILSGKLDNTQMRRIPTYLINQSKIPNLPWACRMYHKSKVPALRPRRCPTNSGRAGEPSPLAPKIIVRYGKYILQKSDLQEKSFFFQKIQHIRNQNLWEFNNYVTNTNLHNDKND